MQSRLPLEKKVVGTSNPRMGAMEATELPTHLGPIGGAVKAWEVVHPHKHGTVLSESPSRVGLPDG